MDGGKGITEVESLRGQLKAQQAACAKLIREKNKACQTIEDATAKIA